MATTLLEKLLSTKSSVYSLKGLTPDTQNSDNSFPSVNDSFQNGSYYDTMESEMKTGNPDGAAAISRIGRQPKRP